MRKVIPDGTLYLAKTREDIEELYALYTNRIVLCPSKGFTQTQFVDMILETLQDPQADMWVYQEPEGTPAICYLTQVRGLCLRVAVALYRADLDPEDAMLFMGKYMADIAKRTGCTALYWSIDKNAGPILERMRTHSTQLLVPKFEADPSRYEFELKL